MALLSRPLYKYLLSGAAHSTEALFDPTDTDGMDIILGMISGGLGLLMKPDQAF